MKQNGRKGLSLPMEIIIGVVVLVVIALAVIMFTSGSITKTGTQTSAQQDQTACEICKRNYCIGNTGTSENIPATTCAACGTSGATGVDCTKYNSPSGINTPV